ncbi:crystallin J1B-like [Saccoglossus kowalevskii]
MLHAAGSMSKFVLLNCVDVVLFVAVFASFHNLAVDCKDNSPPQCDSNENGHCECGRNEEIEEFNNPCSSLSSGSLYQKMTKERAIAAVVGAHVADAAAISKISYLLLEYYILNGNDSKAVEKITEQLGKSPTDNDKKVLTYLKSVAEMKNESHVKASSSYGISCAYPGAFQTAVDAILKHTDFVSAVRGNIYVGGDTCSRIQFIAACLAAQGGIETIPEDWQKKTVCYPRLLELAGKLVE